MSKRVIVLGASGFIGRAIFDGFSKDRSFKTIGYSSKECNLLSYEAAQKALSDITKDDVIVMAAAITRLKENTVESMNKNIQMAENLAKVILERPAAQVIYISSIDVYGCLEENYKDKSLKINEQFALKPDDYYGTGKVKSELLLRGQLSGKKIPLTILRLPGIYGVGDYGKSLISSFIKMITQDGKICIYGDGKDKRDYLFAEDVYCAVKAAVGAKFDGAVNVVGGKSYSIIEIVEMIKSIAKCDCQVSFKPVKDVKNLRIRNLQFDNSLLCKVFPDLKIRELSKGIGVFLEQLKARKN